MHIADIQQAESQLGRLVELAEQGEEVIIARAGEPVARLVPLHVQRGPRQGGQWRGRVRIAADFDELTPEIAEAFGLPAS